MILIDSLKGKAEQEEESLDVVHAALSAIIGDDPTEEQKLSPQVILHFRDAFRKKTRLGGENSETAPHF